MRKLTVAIFSLALLASPAYAKSGHAVSRSAKFAAQLSPAKAAKLAVKGASFPLRHSKRFARAIF